MSEIEVGEYVRTEEGYIGILIEYIPNALNYLKLMLAKKYEEIMGCLIIIYTLDMDFN